MIGVTVVEVVEMVEVTETARPPAYVALLVELPVARVCHTQAIKGQQNQKKEKAKTELLQAHRGN